MLMPQRLRQRFLGAFAFSWLVAQLGRVNLMQQFNQVFLDEGQHASTTGRAIDHDRRRRPRNGTVCIESGRFYGQSFNRLLSLAHMMDYAQTKDLDVQLKPQFYNWYKEEWLDFNATNNLPLTEQSQTFPRIDMESNDTAASCQFTLNSKDWFEGFKVNASYIGLHPALHMLLPLVRKSYLEQAKSRLEKYQQERAAQLNRDIDPQSVRVVTIHSRGLDGKCWPRLQKDHCVLCPPPLPVNRQVWRPTCTYSYDYVYDRIPDDMKQNDEFVAIMLADPEMMRKIGGEFNSSSSAAVVDDASFPVQVAMMILSDMHFGNPGSTIDLVVAHWREGKPIYPYDSYDPIIQFEQGRREPP